MKLLRKRRNWGVIRCFGLLAGCFVFTSDTFCGTILCCGAVLCALGQLAMCLGDAHQCSGKAAPQPTLCCDIQSRPMSPEGKLPQIENHYSVCGRPAFHSEARHCQKTHPRLTEESHSVGNTVRRECYTGKSRFRAIKMYSKATGQQILDTPSILGKRLGFS